MSFKDELLASLARSNPGLAANAQEAQCRNVQARQSLAQRNILMPNSTETQTNAPVGSLSGEALEFRSMNEIRREMESHDIPPRRRTKKRRKRTKDTSLWFNAVALKGVPGAASNKHYAAIAQMYEEQTGCLVVDEDMSNADAQSLRRRLDRSSQNCDTTKTFRSLNTPISQLTARSLNSLPKED